VVIKKEEETPEPEPVVEEFVPMKRPQSVEGRTYKVAAPEAYEEAIYVTINDIETKYGVRPFEMFIMSRVMESYQWITLCTRLVSAIFRQQCEAQNYNPFIVAEFLQTFDPGKQYWSPTYKGQHMKSVVQEIGFILREHFEDLELIERRKRVQKQEDPPVVEVVDEPIDEQVRKVAHDPESQVQGGVASEEDLTGTEELVQGMNASKATGDNDLSHLDEQEGYVVREPHPIMFDIEGGRAAIDAGMDILDSTKACPDCQGTKWMMMGGCPVCIDCGYSRCG